MDFFQLLLLQDHPRVSVRPDKNGDALHAILSDHPGSPALVAGFSAFTVSTFLNGPAFTSLLTRHEGASAVICTPEHESGILGALLEALEALLPARTGQVPEEAPWGIRIATLLRAANPVLKPRILIIDRLDDILHASPSDQATFLQGLTRIAANPAVIVIAGVTTSGLRNLAGFPEIPQEQYEALVRTQPAEPVRTFAGGYPVSFVRA